MKYTDLFMLDIKHMDDAAHRKLTGQTNQNILEMAAYLSDHGKAMWIRHVLVPGITTEELINATMTDKRSEYLTRIIVRI